MSSGLHQRSNLTTFQSTVITCFTTFCFINNQLLKLITKIINYLLYVYIMSSFAVALPVFGVSLHNNGVACVANNKTFLATYFRESINESRS